MCFFITRILFFIRILWFYIKETIHLITKRNQSYQKQILYNKTIFLIKNQNSINIFLISTGFTKLIKKRRSTICPRFFIPRFFSTLQFWAIILCWYLNFPIWIKYGFRRVLRFSQIDSSWNYAIISIFICQKQPNIHHFTTKNGLSPK